MEGCAGDASEMAAVKGTGSASEQDVASFGVAHLVVEDGCAPAAAGYLLAFVGKAEAVDKMGGRSQHVLLDVEAGAGIGAGGAVGDEAGADAAIVGDAGDGAEERPVAAVVVAVDGDETEDGDGAEDAAFEDGAEGVESFGDAVVEATAGGADLEGENDQLAAVQGVAYDFVVAFEDETAQVHLVAVAELEPGFEVELLPEAGDEGEVGPEFEAGVGLVPGAVLAMVPEAVAAPGSGAVAEIEAD